MISDVHRVLTGFLDPANWSNRNGFSFYLYPQPLVAVVLGFAVWQRVPYVENSDVRRLLFASLSVSVRNRYEGCMAIQRLILHTACIIA